MRSSKNPKSDPILPDDIIFEILSRLPVKSLLRFKCVCKPWQTLISSPTFISSHSTHSPNYLLVQYISDLRYILLYLLKSPSDTVPVELPLPFGIAVFDYPEIDVIGSTNGVICFTTPVLDNGLALWNPAIKRARYISSLESEMCDFPASSDSRSWGFGYDPIGNGFTIVKIFNNLPEKNIPSRAYGFSTNSGSWRKMKFQLPVIWVDEGTCDAIVEGVPCWRGLGKEGKEIREVVTCFDVVNDRFLRFLLPDIEKDRCKQLVEYKHSLGMVVWDDSKMNCFDLWVMEKSWSKKFVVGPIFDMEDMMLGFWRGGELVVQDEDAVLVMYNVESRQMRRVDIRPRRGNFAVFDYSETLVSVNGVKIAGGTHERRGAVARGPLLRRLLSESMGRFSSGK